MMPGPSDVGASSSSVGSPLRPQRNKKKFRPNEDLPRTALKQKIKSEVMDHKYPTVYKPSIHSSIRTPVGFNHLANQQQSEKRIAKKVGSRLKNLLKLPKAHKMCIYEWFYSNVDNALFNENNDFCMCLKESFPELKTHTLTRAHWSKIRRLMGKPRRCSEAFFHEERLALANKRNKIRLLQQNKIPKEDQDTWSLPREVPLPLVVGTNVTAWLRGDHHDGLFTGQIDAIDAGNATYRVTFDRSNLGTHVVPDVEVCSFEPQDTINIVSMMDQSHDQPDQRFSFPVSLPTESETSGVTSNPTDHDPILGRSPIRSKLHLTSSVDEEGGTLGGFPIQLLKKVARLSRVLTIKREKIQKLSDMNAQAEKFNSYGETLNLEFQRKYATVVLDLERLNKDLNELLVGVQRFCLELYPEQILPIDETSHIRKQCNMYAQDLIASKNPTAAMGDVDKKAGEVVASGHLTDLVTRLTSLMFQVKTLNECQGTSIEFKSLTDSMKELKADIDPANATCFQNNVEIHIAHIKDGMEHEKYLNSVNSPNTTTNSS